MPITLIAESAAEIPESLRPNAKEENGKFVLSGLPDGWGVDHVAASRTKQTKLENDLKRRDERLKAFAKNEKGDLFEPEEFQSLLKEHGALKDQLGKQPDVEKLRKQIHDEVDGRWTKKFTDTEKRAADLDRELDNATLNSEIDSLVALLRPKEGRQELLKLVLREKLGLDKSEGKRAVRVRDPKEGWLLGNGPDGYTPPKDFALNNLRAQYADMLEGDGASGAGASSSNGSPRRSKYTFPASGLNGRLGEFEALQKKAAAEGLSVEINQNA